MKRIILIVMLIIVIPYLVVDLFIEDENIKFNYVTNNFVRVKRESTGKIENIPFEEYIIGVIAGEMPASYDKEALKAQAVAARSYVLKKMENNDKEYDVVDTIDNQVYLDESMLKKKWGNDYTKYMNKIKEAVLETKGEYLTYDNQVINAFFFSTSNGKTENCEEVFQEKLPYLQSVDSSWDKDSPLYSNEITISLKDFYNKLGLKYNDNLSIKIIDYTKSGSIKNIDINGIKLHGTDVRYKLGLKSTYFSIEKVNDNVKISTKGNGHGVGMSQYGALSMAKLGYSYDKILKYYYTNVEINKF